MVFILREVDWIFTTVVCIAMIASLFIANIVIYPLLVFIWKFKFQLREGSWNEIKELYDEYNNSDKGLLETILTDKEV